MECAENEAKSGDGDFEDRINTKSTKVEKIGDMIFRKKVTLPLLYGRDSVACSVIFLSFELRRPSDK